MTDQSQIRRSSDTTQRRWGTCPDCGRLAEIALGRVSLHRRPTGAQFLCGGVGMSERRNRDAAGGDAMRTPKRWIYRCADCGGTVTVVDGVTQPHDCTPDQPTQSGATDE